MFENFAFTSYCVDINIWGELKKAVEKYNKILIITGEKSFAAVKENLLNALSDKYFEIKNIKVNVPMNTLMKFIKVHWKKILI